MGKWAWTAVAMLAVAAVMVPVVMVRGAEEGGRREAEARPQPIPAAGISDAELPQKVQALRERVESLNRAAQTLEQQGMPEMAREVRARAEQTQRELGGLMEAMPRREGATPARPGPENLNPDMGDMPRRQMEMMGKLLDGQEKLRGQISEVNEKVNAIQRDIAALRERLPR